MLTGSHDQTGANQRLEDGQERRVGPHELRLARCPRQSKNLNLSGRGVTRILPTGISRFCCREPNIEDEEEEEEEEEEKEEEATTVGDRQFLLKSDRGSPIQK